MVFSITCSKINSKVFQHKNRQFITFMVPKKIAKFFVDLTSKNPHGTSLCSIVMSFDQADSRDHQPSKLTEMSTKQLILSTFFQKETNLANLGFYSTNFDRKSLERIYNYSENFTSVTYL